MPRLSLRHERSKYSGLTPAAQHVLQSAGLDAGKSPDYIAGIEGRTAERERDGENDHLIFYTLQSKEFTKSNSA
jgi:hypothetical protein